MNISEMANAIADQLEHKATIEKNKKVSNAEQYYKGYVDACEEFGRQLRQKAAMAANEAGQDGAMAVLKSAT